MKKMFKWFTAMAIVATPVALTGCDKDDDTNNNVQAYSANADGTKAVPANSSTATAQFTGNFNKDTRSFSGTLTYSGITPTNVYIQRGTISTLGSVVVNIGAVVSSPVNFNVTLDAAAEAELNAGTYYIVIASAAYPNGEIRGQLVSN